ncbi:MAG: glycine cleavage system protein R [Candidatus Nanopelagicales bacterium]
MSHFAVTVVSHDRPGLIADVTGILAELGGNLEASSMSLLQGHFAWTLVVAADAEPDDLQRRLLAVCPRGAAVVPLDEGASEAPAPHDRLIVAFHGADRIGITAAITRLLADRGGNIVELTTHLSGGLYLGTAEVEFGSRVDVDELADATAEVGRDLGVAVTVHREEPEVL